MKHQILATASALILAVSANVAIAGGNAAAGKAKAATCNACHGVNGISAIPTYPNLAGQKEAYLVKQMKAFKDKSRKDPTMNAMAAPLSDTDMANLAAHYSGMK
ncbi:MAG: cytochrome c [Gammaproteobacteria bacterium]|nr:MAG: cytochrome c [Gammaproteobacteria bacterium]